MSVKKTLILLLVLISATSLLFTSCSESESKNTDSSEEVFELKLGHVAEPDNPYALGAEKLAELVHERTDGKVSIKIFPSSQLGNQEKLIESLVFGSIDFALTTTAVLGQFEPNLLVFGYPYMFETRDHAYKALDTVGMDVGENLESKGIKILGFFENGIRHMINNDRPIHSPEDMKGLKMRVMTTPVYVELMKSLGADPTPMSFGEVYSACSTGTVDGLEVPAVHIWQKRFFEVNKYVSLTGHTYESEPLTMSMKTWNKLPANYQELIVECTAEALDYARTLAREQESEFFQKIIDSGKTEIIEVDRKPFAEASSVVWEKLATDESPELIKRIQDLR